MIVVVVVLVAFVGDDAAAHNVIAVGLASVLACSVGFAVAAVGVVLASVADALVVAAVVVAACCGCSSSKNHSPSCVDAVPAGFEASTLSPTPTRPSGLTRTLLGAKFRIGLSSPDP